VPSCGALGNLDRLIEARDLARGRVGLAIEIFTRHMGLTDELRLFVVTGFLGALTTFSAFSAEIVGLLARAHYGWALMLASAHLAGSLIATIGGIWVVRWASG
jgi:CrcB protein